MNTVQNIDLVSALSNCASRAAQCTKCDISKTRNKSVFSDGNPQSRVMIVGEGPGEHEDNQGIPYVGPAGILLDKMLECIGLSRDSVYICNVIKCRASEDSGYRVKNRPPTKIEASNCSEYLLEQISLIKPKIIIAFGAPATKALSGDNNIQITKVRGKFFYGPQGIPVCPSFHQAYLLRLSGEDAKRDKKLAWEDLKLVQRFLGGDTTMLPKRIVATQAVGKNTMDSKKGVAQDNNQPFMV